MKNIAKAVKKGFTLIELIIVLALFSLVMFSVLQLLDPVSKFFVRSSNYETTTACIDNMKRAIEGNLKYADRVRVYSGFDPYGSPISAELNGQVNQFWEDFFKDRELIDCEGTIFVLVFDNNPQNGGISGINKLGDFVSQKRNSGKITLISIDFTNTTVDIAGANVQEWYVNQKMYGNYNYKFELGESYGAGIVVTGEDGSPLPSFNPSDCTIKITSNQVSRLKDGTGLVISDIDNTSVASFSMKNVLDPTKKYATPMYDYKVIRNPLSGNDHYKLSDDGQSIEQMKYVIESVSIGGTNEPKPIARYETVVQNPTAGFDGFYFIFTQADSVRDGTDSEYLQEVRDAYSSII